MEDHKRLPTCAVLGSDWTIGQSNHCFLKPSGKSNEYRASLVLVKSITTISRSKEEDDFQEIESNFLWLGLLDSRRTLYLILLLSEF